MSISNESRIQERKMTKTSSNDNKMSEGGQPSFKCLLTWKSLVLHVIVAIAGPFACSKYIVISQKKQLSSRATTGNDYEGTISSHRRTTAINKTSSLLQGFPVPLLHKHKIPPNYRYSGMCLDDPYLEPNNPNEAEKTVWSQHRIDVHLHIEESAYDAQLNHSSYDDEEEEAGHGFDGYQPAGQHMLMDIRNVDPSFLLDAKRMAESMVKTTTQSGLTLLSYHCHDLLPPMGVSCVGVLLESHVSIHTWPQAGVLSLDLFTCGPASLLPLVPLLENLFAIPSPNPTAPTPVAHWIYKKRGYRDYQNVFANQTEEVAEEEVPDNAEGVELENFFLGWKGYAHKEVIVNQKTEYQEVGLFEVSHAPSDDKTAHAAFRNKKLFLDNVAQSSLNGLEAYHEALVHPAMLAHPNPKRVAIIGGGEGATLREVLKHKTVEKCVMLDIDEELMHISRQHMPEWHNCSDFDGYQGEGGFFSCFDHPRAEVYNVDAVDWFVERFAADAGIQEDKFDVIIMDALDPSSFVSFSDVLYNGEDFVESLTSALTPNGILVAQVGQSMELNNKGETRRSDKVLEEFTRLLREYDADAMKTYTEGHGEFLSPWDFRIVFMNSSIWLPRWYAEPSWVDLELAKRAVPTKSRDSPFQYMDGSLQQFYQYPSRIQESAFCDANKDKPFCDSVRGYDPDVLNLPASSLELGPSRLPRAGRGVFFTQSFPKGTYLSLGDSVHNMVVMPLTTGTVEDMMSLVAKKWKNIENYVDGYGFDNDFFGAPSSVVDAGIATFVNHGCNGTYNIGTKTNFTELTVEPDQLTKEFSSGDRDYFFNPAADRNTLTTLTSADGLIRDVSAGEEVLDNYLVFSVQSGLTDQLIELQSVCLGQGGGRVFEVEGSYDNDSDEEEKENLGVRGDSNQSDVVTEPTTHETAASDISSSAACPDYQQTSEG